MNDRSLVGLGLMLLKDGKVLLGKRKSALGNGEYSGLGGHLESMESFEDSLLREVAEEGGPDLKLKNLRFLCVSNLTKYAPKHYVDIGMIADWESGEPHVMEPEKLESWCWYDLDNLPTPLFSGIENYLVAYKTGETYFTS